LCSGDLNSRVTALPTSFIYFPIPDFTDFRVFQAFGLCKHIFSIVTSLGEVRSGGAECVDTKTRLQKLRSCDFFSQIRFPRRFWSDWRPPDQPTINALGDLLMLGWPGGRQSDQNRIGKRISEKKIAGAQLLDSRLRVHTLRPTRADLPERSNDGKHVLTESKSLKNTKICKIRYGEIYKRCRQMHRIRSL